MSFHGDIGMGQVSPVPTPCQLCKVAHRPVLLTGYLDYDLFGGSSNFHLVCSVAFPTAYSLAQIGGWFATLSLSLVLATSLIVLIVIKLIGLQLLLWAFRGLERAIALDAVYQCTTCNGE